MFRFSSQDRAKRVWSFRKIIIIFRDEIDREREKGKKGNRVNFEIREGRREEEGWLNFLKCRREEERKLFFC
jgi:hypothetical protein